MWPTTPSPATTYRGNPMRLSTVIAAVVLANPRPGTSLTAQGTLRVLRHTPGDVAAPSSIVTVMFDRPVAGALDATTPAARLFHIAPNVAGSVTWRDQIGRAHV